MAMVRVLVLLVRFLSELAALVGLCMWGFEQNVFAGVGAPVVAGAAWARFAAPKSARCLPDPARIWFEVLFFGVATIAWTKVASGPAGLAFGAVAIAVALATRVVGEPEQMQPARASDLPG